MAKSSEAIFFDRGSDTWHGFEAHGGLESDGFRMDPSDRMPILFL